MAASPFEEKPKQEKLSTENQEEERERGSGLGCDNSTSKDADPDDSSLEARGEIAHCSVRQRPGDSPSTELTATPPQNSEVLVEQLKAAMFQLAQAADLSRVPPVISLTDSLVSNNPECAKIYLQEVAQLTPMVYETSIRLKSYQETLAALQAKDEQDSTSEKNIVFLKHVIDESTALQQSTLLYITHLQESKFNEASDSASSIWLWKRWIVNSEITDKKNYCEKILQEEEIKKDPLLKAHLVKALELLEQAKLCFFDAEASEDADARRCFHYAMVNHFTSAVASINQNTIFRDYHNNIATLLSEAADHYERAYQTMLSNDDGTQQELINSQQQLAAEKEWLVYQTSMAPPIVFLYQESSPIPDRNNAFIDSLQEIAKETVRPIPELSIAVPSSSPRAPAPSTLLTGTTSAFTLLQKKRNPSN